MGARKKRLLAVGSYLIRYKSDIYLIALKKLSVLPKIFVYGSL